MEQRNPWFVIPGQYVMDGLPNPGKRPPFGAGDLAVQLGQCLDQSEAPEAPVSSARLIAEQAYPGTRGVSRYASATSLHPYKLLRCLVFALFTLPLWVVWSLGENRKH